jgi:hypothetical protein
MHLGGRLPLLAAVDGLFHWVQKYEPTENDFNRRVWTQADIQTKVGVPIGL